MDKKLQDAIALTESLIAEHDILKDWKVVLIKRKTAFGICRYYKKVIGLSSLRLPHCTYDSIWNTIIHEVAHALAFKLYGHKGHGRMWKELCVELGGNGLRCTPDEQRYETGTNKFDVDAKISKYVATCPNGHIHYRNRKPKREVSCGICSKYFDKRYLITYELNKQS
jgi:predicted SprT family Zn-dependent metalloprotease